MNVRYHHRMNSRRRDRLGALRVDLALHLKFTAGGQAAADFLASRGVSIAVAMRVLNRPAEFRRSDVAGPCYPGRFDGVGT